MRSVNTLRARAIGAGQVIAFVAAFDLSADVRAEENSKPAAWWPQFRGPDGLAVADGKKLPAEFGPKKNVLWKTPLPSGHARVVGSPPTNIKRRRRDSGVLNGLTRLRISRGSLPGNYLRSSGSSLVL